jgi:hypothetical protein
MTYRTAFVLISTISVIHAQKKAAQNLSSRTKN